MKYLLLSCLLLAGCSTAGPFVSNISSDGKGNLIVERQNVEYNYFLGVVSNKNLTTTSIKVGNEN